MWYPPIPEFGSAKAEHLQLGALAESGEKLVADFAFPGTSAFNALGPLSGAACGTLASLVILTRHCER